MGGRLPAPGRGSDRDDTSATLERLFHRLADELARGDGFIVRGHYARPTPAKYLYLRKPRLFRDD
jgi:hypothetical protein